MKKTALITGAYGVIGRAISEMMAEAGYALFLLGRDKEKMEKVGIEIALHTGNPDIRSFGVDQSRKEMVKQFAASIDEKISVLINNAGATPTQRLETPEGIEMQWATNVLGYVWMTKFLEPHIPEGGRVVNVASFYAGSLDMNDVEFRKRGYDNDTAYRQSKQANRMLSTWFAGLLMDCNIAVNSCHPGEISSKLSNNLGFYFPDPPRVGADTPVWLASSPEVEGITGRFFQYRKDTPCRFSNNKDEMRRLYDLCLEY